MRNTDLGLPRPSHRLYRLLRGPYTLQELSDILGVNTTTIAAWEALTARPRMPHLRRLIDHYHMWSIHLGCDPLALRPHKRRASAPAAPRKLLRGTPAAPSLTPAKLDAAAPAAPSPPAPSLSREGGAEKL